MNGSGCSMEEGSAMPMNACRNASEDEIDLARAGSLIVIFFFAFVGNICTVVIVSKFKIHRVPDVLVIGIACTDLVATLIPVPMALYAYLTLNQYGENSFTCKFFATIAHFTRYSSVLIVTLVAIERYFAINRPFIYRKYATPKRFVGILIVCWVVSFVYGIIPVVIPNSHVDEYEGFCIFDITSHYAISVLVYGGTQFVVVFVCFVLVMVQLLQVYRRRKQLKVEERKRPQARGRPHPLLSRPSLSSR